MEVSVELFNDGICFRHRWVQVCFCVTKETSSPLFSAGFCRIWLPNVKDLHVFHLTCVKSVSKFGISQGAN